ncbi:hypothetical protein BJV78DRAFT_922805 [Lactifluus subvellereus]|nr:hypothetical protein BJV78DRAFT_922805 [Lactifluus subvellereus]
MQSLPVSFSPSRDSDVHGRHRRRHAIERCAPCHCSTLANLNTAPRTRTLPTKKRSDTWAAAGDANDALDERKAIKADFIRNYPWNIFDIIVATGSLLTTISARVGASGYAIHQLQKLFLVSIHSSWYNGRTT